MAEYISKEYALSCVDSFLSKTGMPIAAQYFYDCFRECEAADVQPVRHGRWIWDSNAPHRDHGAYKCDNCGCHSDFEENYCYNCGVKMDGDTNG